MTQEDFFNRYSYNVRDNRIGGGGFGTVYKAYDNTLHRDVAIKVSEVKTAANGKVFSLKDEFDALKHLPKHPNIANYEQFYRFETPQGIFDYAIMQYYPDGNLSNIMGKGLAISQKEDIARQLLEGVEFLHRHSVVHRDLKPGNILVVRHGGQYIPLITDFGLSKTANATDGGEFSNSFGGGTPRYSSPEQLRGKALKLNTDLWSYGAIIYELFTDKPLFEAGSGAANTAEADHEIYNKIVNGIISDQYVYMPERWKKVVERCIVVNPQQRVQSCGELRQIVGMESYREPKGQDNENLLNNNGLDETFYEDTTPSQSSSRNYSSSNHSTDYGSSSSSSNALIQNIESLQAQGMYRDAYSACLDLIKRNMCTDYANGKVKELLPLITKKQKKAHRKEIWIIIIVTIVAMIIFFLMILMEG